MRDRKGSTVYRPEIDGLRALAIVPVILFHTGFDAFGGGFIGVDVFFVISGFLITSIILSEMADKKFRLVKFYERRARRILPALFLAFTLSAVLAYFVLLPHQIKDLAQSIAAATLFVSNFFFYLETDYFNEFTSKSPLLHTWTLAVEEQFYLLFPLLLLIVFPLGKVKLNLLVVGLLLTSFVFAVATVAQDRDLAFYGTHTRAWELMVGCVLAINRDAILAWTNARLSDVSERLAYEVAGVLALTGIIFSVLFFSEKTVHPSFITALPVISTAILLLVGHRASVVKAVLAHPVAVLIGLLSYSLYIFHQPIISFLRFSSFGEAYGTHPAYPYGVVLLTVAVSAASYFYFERPIRFSRKFGTATVIASSGAFIVTFTAVGYWGHANNGFQSYFASEFQKKGGVLLVDADAERGAMKAFAKVAYRHNGKPFTPAAPIRVLVIGDSMANDAYLSLYRYGRDTGSRELDVRKLKVDDECMARFVDDLSRSAKYSGCLAGRSLADIKNLLQNSTTVLITAKWQESTFKQGYGLAEYIDRTYGSKVSVVGSMMFQDLTSVSMALAKNGVDPESSKKKMYENIRFDRWRISNKLQALVAADPHLNWVEKSDFFCNRAARECTLFNSRGQPLIWDNAHLTYRAYMPYAKFILSHVSEPRVFTSRASSVNSLRAR